MKFFLKLLPLVVLFLTIGCQNNEKKNEVKGSDNPYYLKISLENTAAEYAVLYGFWGDQQIQIDSLSIIDGIIKYDISEKCNMGVYRLVLSDFGFDFIFNNENVEIKVDPNNSLNPIEIISSEENRVFYIFQNEYFEIYKEEDSLKKCTLLNDLKSLYSGNNQSDKYANKIISFIINLDLSCYSIPDITHEEIQSILNQVSLDEELLATPYFVSKVLELLNTFKDRDMSLVEKIYDVLNERVDKESIVNHFITVSFWEVGLQDRNKKLLYPIVNDSTCLEWMDGYSKVFSIGDRVEEDICQQNDSYKKHVIMFNSPICSLSNTELRKFENQFSNGLDINFMIYDVGDLEQSIRLKYNLFVFPTILILDGENNLISRWIGTEDCKRILHDNN
jgi:hypothetical protein